MHLTLTKTASQGSKRLPGKETMHPCVHCSHQNTAQGEARCFTPMFWLAEGLSQLTDLSLETKQNACIACAVLSALKHHKIWACIFLTIGFLFLTICFLLREAFYFSLSRQRKKMLGMNEKELDENKYVRISGLLLYIRN